MRTQLQLVSGLLGGLMLLTGCGQGDAAAPDLVDPQSAEFLQRRDEAAKVAMGLEVLAAQAAGAKVEPEARQEVTCLAGNRGPKGKPDDFDSVCRLQRFSIIKTPDPVKALLSIDGALRKNGYPASWRGGRGGSVPIEVDDVRRGKVPPADVTSVTFGTMGLLTISLQVGRLGSRPTYAVQQGVGVGYFNEAAGAGWEVAGPRTEPLQASVLAVAITDDSFIERLRTDWG